jgi:hypothetical protein
MKNKLIKPILLAALSLGVFSSCVKDDDFDIPKVTTAIFSEDFNEIDSSTDGDVFDFEGWTNYAEVGTALWTKEFFNDDLDDGILALGTVQFNPFSTDDATSVSWLISPSIGIAGIPRIKMSFQSAKNFVTDDENNKVELYVSTDYDGSNFDSATWKLIPAKFVKASADAYYFIPSGEIDLSQFEGAEHINVAFKGIGSGTDANLDGLYQINDLIVYTSSK